jgi:hypothetical protein
LNIVLDDAVEEKDGGEKVRLGMVVSIPLFLKNLRARADIKIGHSRKLCGDARGLGENRRWKRRQRLRNNTATKVAEETLFRRQNLLHLDSWRL